MKIDYEMDMKFSISFFRQICIIYASKYADCLITFEGVNGSSFLAKWWMAARLSHPFRCLNSS